PYEVRKEDEYFADIEDEKIPKDMMELASHIVETKSGHFKPEEFALRRCTEGATEKEAVRREDRSAKSTRTSQSHQSYGCASPKRGRRAVAVRAIKANGVQHSAALRRKPADHLRGRRKPADSRSERAILDATQEGLSPAYRQRGDRPSNSAA